MGLETATYISQLVVTNPVHTDGLNQGDGHLRLVKATLQGTFPNFTAAPLNSSQAQIDSAVQLLTGAGGVAAFPAGTAAAPSISFNGDPDSGFYKTAEDQVALSLAGFEQALFTSTQFTFAQPVNCSSTVFAGGAYSGGTGQIAMAGAIWMYQGPSAPTGWAWMNGQIVSASANPILAAIYGSTGGNVTLPDWRDFVPIGQGNMGGTSDRGVVTLSGIDTMNAGIGEAAHTLVVGECPTGLSTLTFTDPGHNHTYGTLVGGSSAGWTAGNATGTSTSNTGTSTTGITCALTEHGGNGGHNNVQPSVVTGFIIKLG